MDEKTARERAIEIENEITDRALRRAFWYLYPQPELSWRSISDGKSETMQPPTMYDEFLSKGSF